MNDRLDQVPIQVTFIKSILANKEKLEELLQITKAPQAPLLKTPPMSKTLIKKEHPGKFVIPCSIGNTKLNDALCDSGAFVNVISLALVEEMGIKGMKPNSTPLVFGDASKKTPKEIIENYPLLVGNCIVPTDLLVLDMVDSKKQPLILGAPFLTTVGAVIDYVTKVVVLKNVDEMVSYDMEPPMSSCGTITREGASIELKVSTIVEDTPSLVKDMFKCENKLENELPLENATTFQDVETKLKVSTLIEDTSLLGIKDVYKGEHEVENVTSLDLVAPLEKVEKKPKQEVTIDKVATVSKKKKKKLAKAHFVQHDSSPPSLTFMPLNIIDGKLECKVKSSGHSRPFAKVRIILDPVSKEHNLGLVSEKMSHVFGIKFKDKGPFQDGSSSPT